MNSLKKQNSQTQSSLFESLLNDYGFKSQENFKNDNTLGYSQEFRMTKAEVQSFLNEVSSEQMLLDEVESIRSFEENQEQIMEEKSNAIDTQECLTQQNQFSLIGCGKLKNRGDFILKDELEIEVEQQINSRKEMFKAIFKQRKLKGEWKKNTNVPKFLVRIFMKHFSSCISQQSSEQILKHHREMKKTLQSRVSNNYSISDVLSLLRSSQFSSKSLNIENQKILSKIICKTLHSEVVENKYIKNNQMSYMMAIKLYAIRCRNSSLTERVKIF